MSAHTPGPWKKSERLNGPWWHISSGHSIDGQECGSGRQAIACVHGESKRGAKAYAEMFEANARLIAAAPELLMALKELLGPYVDKPSETTGMMDLLVCGEDIDAARAAIAKAIG